MAEILRHDQIGSYLRPAALLDARLAFSEGNIDGEALAAIEDEAIIELLQMQRDVGLGIYSDGELRRLAWMSGLSDAVEGFTEGHRVMHWHNLDGSEEDEPSLSRVAGAKIRQVRRLTGGESAFLQEHSPGAFKITMPSPLSIAASGYQAGVTDKAYPDRADFLKDLLDIVRGEMIALAEEGVTYIQLDEGFTGYLGDYALYPVDLGGMTKEQALQGDIAAENSLYDAVKREGLTLAMHVCGGNSRSRWAGTGGYAGMAEHIFNELHVDRFLLEYDTERAGSFEPLKYLPKGKVVVLGLVTTKTGELEDQEGLLRRIDEASKYAPLDQLALSPQCGFASVADGNLLSEEEQWRKMELVIETARRVWG